MDNHYNMISRVLGWSAKPDKILPHENQAKREVDRDTGKTRSVRARDVLQKDDYMRLASENAFDLLFYYVVKRLVLERMNCATAADKGYS